MITVLSALMRPQVEVTEIETIPGSHDVENDPSFSNLYPADRPSDPAFFEEPKSPSKIEGELQSQSLSHEDLNIFIEHIRYSHETDRCGKHFGRGIACKAHYDETIKFRYYHCGRPGCWICGGHWAWREGVRAADCLVGIRSAYIESGPGCGPVDHVVFSPPLSEYERYKKELKTREGYRRLRSEAYKIMQIADCKGGAPIFHDQRSKHEDGSVCEDKPNCTLEHIWYFSPHWHGAVVGWLKNFTKFTKESGGWIYKRIRGDLNHDELIGLIHYLLTHAGLVVDSEGAVRCRSVTYFGILSPSKVWVSHQIKPRWMMCTVEGCEKRLRKVEHVCDEEDNIIEGKSKWWAAEVGYNEDVVTYQLRNSGGSKPVCSVKLPSEWGKLPGERKVVRETRPDWMDRLWYDYGGELHIPQKWVKVHPLKKDWPGSVLKIYLGDRSRRIIRERCWRENNG